MTGIYLVTQAEVEGSFFRRVHGRSESRLTMRGQLQLNALARRFRHIPVAAVYSSDQRSAWLTAESIAQACTGSLDAIADLRLRELDFGSWEDKPWGEVAYESPELLDEFLHAPAQWRLENAESFEALARRMLTALYDIAERHNGETVVLVSHMLALRALLSVLYSRDIASFPSPSDSGVTLLNYESGEVTVEFADDISHLGIGGAGAYERSGTDGAPEQQTDLRFVPVDLAAEREEYINCYEDTWLCSSGTLRGFDGDVYHERATEHAAYIPGAVTKAVYNGTLAGIVDMNLEREQEEGAGWISLFYLRPEFRSRGLGIQLLGHAVSLSRGLGRDKLRLHVSTINKPALRFYRRWGFTECGSDMGAVNRMYIMEKLI